MGMSTASILPEATAVVGSATHLELGAVALVVVMVIATLLVRMKLNRDQRIRKAASQGYYDPDVAHYVHGPVPDAPSGPAADDTDRALAPSFTAPLRSKASKRGPSRSPAPRPSAPRPSAPRPVTAAFGPGDALPPRPVPAFDQAVAVANRPATTRAPFTTRAPSAPAAPLPPPPAGPPTTVPTGPPTTMPVGAPPTMPVGVPALSLPRMEQSLPPGSPVHGHGPAPDRGDAPGR
jgi:hypothetical protein